jgi:hypothetical protein
VINFTGTSTDGRTFLSVGLSHENLRRLKADQPIRIDLTKLGIVVPPHEVVIFAGETEAIMTDRLYAHGAIGPDTITHGVEGEGGD